MTFPHTLQERKGPFTCPRCGSVAIRFVRGAGLMHDYEALMSVPVCNWLDEATDEQAEALK